MLDMIGVLNAVLNFFCIEIYYIKTTAPQCDLSFLPRSVIPNPYKPRQAASIAQSLYPSYGTIFIPVEALMATSPTMPITTVVRWLLGRACIRKWRLSEVGLESSFGVHMGSSVGLNFDTCGWTDGEAAHSHPLKRPVGL